MDNIIGSYTSATTTENGYGAHLQREYPKTENYTHGDVERQKRQMGDPEQDICDENCTMGQWGAEKYTSSLTGPDGHVRRQYDYIAINEKYMGAVRTARGNSSCHAIVSKNRNRVQKMQLYYIRFNIYKTPIPMGTGGILKYDLQELRLRPGKLTKFYQDPELRAHAMDTRARIYHP